MSDTQVVKLNASIAYQCGCCRQVQQVRVNANDWLDWQEGKLIQEAMPYLNADQREIMISGTCGACFDAMFADCE
jgi:hypothetical protein